MNDTDTIEAMAADGLQAQVDELRERLDVAEERLVIRKVEVRNIESRLLHAGIPSGPRERLQALHTAEQTERPTQEEAT